VEEGGQPIILSVVQFPSWAAARTVTAEPLVVLDSGTEDPADSADPPVVQSWRSVEDGDVVMGAALPLHRSSDRVWEIRVRPTADAVVRLNLRVEDGAPTS
jgi:hypothetical protein